MAAAAAQTLPPQVIPRLTDADFQTELTRVSGALASAQFTPVAGHKIATITRAGQAESLRYQRTDGTDGGSQRTEDARFRYEFDERGRLRKVTEKLAGQSRLKRVVYSYNAMDRMVGRQVETAPVTNGQQPQESDWSASSESTTFVWDPFSDQLIAMFEAGSGRPLRQFIHGGIGYDDPIEVFDGMKRYYPILDEAGTGSLQAVVDEQGQLVNRTIIADPYGEDAETLNGPAVDKITISGTSSDVKVRMHVTEPVDPSTLSGARLVPSATPVLTDPYTITWTLTSLPEQGNLSFEVTTLRSTTFGPSVPVLFGGFTISVSAIPRDSTITPYNVTSLATLGTRTTTDVSAALVMSPFKAHPFTDPFTGLDYVRARWLDRRTGTFLTPDPVGYRDSANLYAYCAGDPVNCGDPSGKAVYVVYRALDIQGGAAVYPAAGHVYLGFDSEGLPDLAHWRALVNHIGGQRGADPRLRRDPNPEAETFSFHPTSVLTQSGDNNLVSTTVTRGSYVGYNDARADQIPFRRAVRELNAFGPTPLTKMREKGAIVFRIAATQQQQEQLYVAAIASRDSINWGLNQSGSYKLGTNNCASWAQDMVLREGLKWPRAAMLCNGGAALGGPISGLAAAATAALDIVGYERYGLRLMKEDWMKQNSAPPDPLAQNWITKYRETMQKAGALPIQ